MDTDVCWDSLLYVNYKMWANLNWRCLINLASAECIGRNNKWWILRNWRQGKTLFMKLRSMFLFLISKYSTSQYIDLVFTCIHANYPGYLHIYTDVGLYQIQWSFYSWISYSRYKSAHFNGHRTVSCNNSMHEVIKYSPLLEDFFYP